MAAGQLRKNKGCSKRDGGQVMAAGQVCRDKDKKKRFRERQMKRLISGGKCEENGGSDVQK
ncbi:MAG: hypothetical protein ACOXZ0_05150 [Eubacteriales bacterium]|jgi:hypothetical protein